MTRGYRCACLEGAFGTPGTNGSGCTVPAVAVVGGSLQLGVSDQNDVEFVVGSTVHSVRGLHAAVQAVGGDGGTVDTRLQAATSQLAGMLSAQLKQSQTDGGQAVVAMFAGQASVATAAASSDAGSKVNSAVLVAAGDASTKSAALLGAATGSTAGAAQGMQASLSTQLATLDAQVLAAAAGGTDAVRAVLSAQVSGMCMARWGASAGVCGEKRRDKRNAVQA